MAVDRDTLDGFFKTRYADKIEYLQPSFNKLSRAIPFETAKKLGKDYQFPVRVSRAMGVTWAGGSAYGTAFDLGGAVSGVTKNATVEGTELVLEEAISYGAISGAMSNIEAFGSAFDEVVADMTTSAAFFREMALLYGGTSIGTVTGTPGQPTATSATVVISLATWAPGLWVQMEGGKLDIYASDGTTKRNDSSASAVYTVTSVDTETRTITMAGEATDIDAIASTDLIRPAGATSNWFTGIDGILSNTGSLFGIDAATYSLWKSGTYAAGGVALTMAKLTAAAAKSTVRGGMRDLKAYVSTYTWTDLNNDHAALRRFGDSTKGGLDLGTKGDDNSITYYGPNGKLEICPHPMVKGGEAFLLDPSTFRRVGSTDTTFNLGVPGSEPNFFQELPTKAGVGLRCYWDQALICARPNTAVKVTGIVNTAS